MNPNHFADIKRHCQEHSRLSAQLVDELVIPLTAQSIQFSKLEKGLWAPHKRLLSKVPANFVGLVNAMYLSVRAFGKNGIIQKLMRQSALSTLSKSEQDFLQLNRSHPWQTSFARVLEQPAPDFFQMIDILTDEEYLLYAPSMSSMLLDGGYTLWMNLIAFNGHCYQTFGVVTGFRGFLTDDIFFYAMELNEKLHSAKDIMEDIEVNPLRYWILYAGAHFPLVTHLGEPMIFCWSEDFVLKFPFDRARSNYRMEWKGDMFKFTSLDSDITLPANVAYYDESNGKLFRNTFNESSFEEWTLQLNRSLGLRLSEEADIAVSMTMLTFMSDAKLLKYDWFAYEKLFGSDDEPSDTKQESMEQLNAMLQELSSLLNSNQKIDIRQLAEKYHLQPEDVEKLYAHMKERIDSFGGKR